MTQLDQTLLSDDGNKHHCSISNMNSRSDEAEDLLVATSNNGTSSYKDSSFLSLSSSPSSKSSVELQPLVKEQHDKTSTFWGKLTQFTKIALFGYQNKLEQYILLNEANDCALVAKYATVVDVDLKRHTSLSIDSITLAALKIPHPLTNFTKNEANQQMAQDIKQNVTKELEESPIILFIHGMGGQMSQFEPLMGLLSQCSEVVSLDLPGFGNSKLSFNDKHKFLSPISITDRNRISTSIAQMTWEDFTTENIVNIVFEFISQQIPDNRKIILVGHSMGTHISIKVAKKLPRSKVEGLILLAPPDIINDTESTTNVQKPLHHRSLSLFKIFTHLPRLFDYFRIWDRLPGLQSTSVMRQLSRENNSYYNSLRQFRWNLDVNSSVSLRYAKGFERAKTSDLVTAIEKFNDNPNDKHTYEKTLFIGGSHDQLTGVRPIYDADNFLTRTFGKKVSSAIEVKDVGHSLLLVKPEFISGIILNHIEQKFPERLHLSPAWVLKVKAIISGDKWGLKNELKWLNLKPISSNITRRNGTDIAPLLGMKTLREGDQFHSPTVVESFFYDDRSSHKLEITGNLIAIIDISADIPPYSPKSFQNIQYYKCATVSKVVPDQSSIRRFIQLVNDILQSNSSTNGEPLIGVHCHYGFNRTGFLICCYLIEELGWSVQEAVEGFRRAKEPGIKHPHFIDALYVRYDT